jgi:Leucine-rich repeat (LRR) protein
VKKILFFILLSTFCFGQQWSISFAERSALITLYNATGGENWSQKWDMDKDPKSWYGIKIKNGEVIEINLRGNALRGIFPTTLSGFKKLEKLDLSSNQLTGEISSAVSGLNKLVRLDVSNNRLTGDPANIILPLSNLQEISVGNNNFTFTDIETFLQNFLNIKVLDLANIGLTAVPQKISVMSQLQVLNLSNNSISQKFNYLSSLSTLSDLNLSGNQLTKIPTEIGALTNLKSLNLSHNKISPNFTSTLSSLKNLEWLALAGNEFTNFPTELGLLKKLIHVNFSENKISGGFETLTGLKNLEQIYLDKNLIVGNFPSTLLQLDKLQMLSLKGNQLSGEIPAVLPPVTFLDNNRFTKAAIRNFLAQKSAMADFTYSPQRYDEPKTVFATIGSAATLSQELSGSDYQFTWFKNLDKKTGALAETYYTSNVVEEDYTDYTCEAYYFEVLPTELMELSFFREPITLAKDLATAEVKTDLVVYPNPASDFLYIKTTKLDVEKSFIFDLSGKLLMTGKSKTLNIAHLPAAVYILSVKTSQGLKSFKFIKK